MFWVTGAGGCTLHRTGRSSKTISPCTDITCTDSGALGPHLATSGFYHLTTDTKMITLVTLEPDVKCPSPFCDRHPNIFFAHCTVSRIKARPLLRGYVRWSVVSGGHNGGDGLQTLTRCHDVSRGWQECDKSVTRVWRCDVFTLLSPLWPELCDVTRWEQLLLWWELQYFSFHIQPGTRWHFYTHCYCKTDLSKMLSFCVKNDEVTKKENKERCI